MIGRGFVEAEEKRSYGALFLLVIALLVACGAWAIWQDSFSRHLWKKYKADFYRYAIAKYEKELADDQERLSKDPKYTELVTELATAEKTDRNSPEILAKQAELEKDLDRANVRVNETDLDLRFVKGKIEESWYLLESAEHSGQSGANQHARLEKLFVERDQRQQAYDGAVAKRDAIQAQIDGLTEREAVLKEKLRPFLKNREAINLRLDSVSMKLFGARVPAIPVLEQKVIPAFERNNFEQWVDRVDRCQNCHVAIDTDGFENEPNPWKTHPDRHYYIGKHEKLGCTPCHGGQGPSINSVKQAHGQVPFWEDPLLDVKDKVQAKCLTCHDSALGLKGAEIAAHGETLFREMGCHGCHLLAGFENLPKAGPSLKRIAAKANPEWLVSWVEKPHKFRPRTRMPDFLLKREDAEAIASYLLSSSADDSLAWLGEHPAASGVDSSDATLVATGKELTRTLGCLGCHGFEPDAFASQVAIGKDVAPNLARIAEKTTPRWIYNWISNPRGYSEVARMPSLRLTEQEATALTSYLSTLRQQPTLAKDDALRAKLADSDEVKAGAKLIRRYGCYGCHVINGMEGESRVSVELTTFGGKTPDELFFGDRLDVPRTWEDWTINKILTPRTYATERIEQNMPMFEFDKADARALVVFLASKVEHKINPIYLAQHWYAPALRKGRQLVAHYNCNGCHTFDGKDGAIRRYYDNLENAPPILVGEGLKLQPAWFLGFLKKPVRLRPWLKVRMPTFGLSDEEADGIVAYFGALEGYNLGPVVVQTTPGAGPGPQHYRSYPEGYFDCGACHMIGPSKPEKEDFWVSRKNLTDADIDSWVSENLGVQMRGTAAATDKGQALHQLLGDAGGS